MIYFMSALSLFQSLILVLLLQCSNHVTDSRKPCIPLFESHKEHFLCGCTAEFAEKEWDGTPVSKGPASLWPGGLVFYDVDKDFDVWFQNRIFANLEFLERLIGKDHIEFRLIRNSKGDLCARDQYILIKRNRKFHCEAPVGMGEGVTTFHLDQDACFEDYGIIYPMLKMLGMQYEWNRSDRDKHVRINMNEIFSKSCGSLKPRETPDATEKLPYDYLSIMHYPSCKLSCRGNFAFLDMNGLPILDANYNMTELDIAKLRTLYPKDKKAALLMDTCGRGSKDQKRDPATPVRSQYHNPVVYIDNDDAIKSTGVWKLTVLMSVAMTTFALTLLT